MKRTLIACLLLIAAALKTNAQSSTDAWGNPASDASAAPFREGASVSSAAAPVILHVIPSPTMGTCEIDYDGQNLWVTGYADFVIFKISPVTGAVLKTIPSSIMRPYGLAFAAGNLWITDTDNHIIQQVDTATGSVISSFPTPCVSSSSYPAGLAWNGSHLWHNDPMGTMGSPNDSTVKITTSGAVVARHHAFGTYTSGLAWDGSSLWSSNNITQEIYKINPGTFSVTDTIQAPGGPYPNGLAFDGQYLWVANNYTDSIYKIKIKAQAQAGVDELNVGSLLSVYPSPAHDVLTVEYSGTRKEIYYFISDQLGRCVLNGRLNAGTGTIDISGFASGMYFLNTETAVGKPLKFLKE
jgi:DNA-binding beta-propeller fold protein YncE